ncbi:zinc ribbon domain-containing protein, partial [Malonomonas rubra]|uniref:zinc ribbon domain-containing protein n=1 Tax=Malonomonas rubra TaxID=57040 RepID=UPI0026EEF1A9
LATRTHRCPSCGLVIDRDHNAALNILSRAGTARSHARGESSDGGTARNSRSTSHGSLKQEAPSLAAG